MNAKHGVLRAYIATLAVLNLLLLYRLTATVALPDEASDIFVAVSLAVMLALSYRFRIQFDFKTFVALDTSVIFAAVLLFEPGTATLAVLIGALAGHATRPFDAVEYSFNILQITLQAGLAAIVLDASGWSYGAVEFDGTSGIVALVVVPLIIFGLNAASMSVVIALQSGLRVTTILFGSAIRNDGIELLGQFIVGLFAAIVVTDHPWTIVLFIIPALIIRTSLQRQYDLRMRTNLAVERLADLVDLRDPYTAEHSRRVAEIARLIATEMNLEFDRVSLIARAGRVHDLGKIFIDIELLTKPGRLTDEEWKIFERHPVDGVRILDLFPDFSEGRNLVLHHHERIDGRGYPGGLKGDAIPLGARILAVADGFDAMASSRPYRDALPADTVLAELRRGRATQWDPTAVDALIALIDRRRILFGTPDTPPRIVDDPGTRSPITMGP